jgi:hypothetical protein
MKNDRLWKLCIILLTVFAGVVALRPVISPESVRAQVNSSRSCGLQFEPGTTMVRTPGVDVQTIGKVAYDTCNGKVWGFPTTTSAPYPVDTVNPAPPVSHPIYLGMFAVDATQK